MTEDWIITYPDGLVINLKDRPSLQWEPCDCSCHKYPKGVEVHIMPCCISGWKKKRNMQVQKYINKGLTYEVGDFYGGDGENDVIRKMEIDNHILIITTNHDHEVAIQNGAWAKFTDGTTMTFEEDVI